MGVLMMMALVREVNLLASSSGSRAQSALVSLLVFSDFYNITHFQSLALMVAHSNTFTQKGKCADGTQKGPSVG